MRALAMSGPCCPLPLAAAARQLTTQRQPQARPFTALRQRQRQRVAGVCRAAAAGPPVDVETARKLLDGPTMVLDIRPAAEYEDGRITKPPRRTVGMPFAAGQDGGAFVAQVAAQLPSRAARIIVMCSDGGQASAEAAALLAAAGYESVAQMEGGYQAYCQVWGPSGKRRPPAGRWVSTGKEALKSGLNIPGVAESYDEGGNLQQARWAKGLSPGETLPHPAKSLGGRSEASAGNQSETSSGAAAGAPPPELSQLVRRKVSVPQQLFERLDAQEKAHRLLAEGPPARCSGCCLPVLSPSSRIYAWWALLMLLLDLTYTGKAAAAVADPAVWCMPSIFCPVSVALAPRDHLVNWAFIVDFIAGALFTVDIVANFSCGYIITRGMQQQVVLRRAGVARIYITRGTFLVDAVSSAAWFAQLAVVILSWSGSNPTEHIELAHALRVARILRILRVLRLVKQLYLSHMSGAKRLLGLKPHTLHCLQLLYGSWVTRYNPFIARYSADGSSPLTMGYGDTVPWNSLETAVTMGVQLLGIMFFGALLSSIAAIIQRASKAARRGQALQDKLASIEQYMREQRVPREVRRRVKRYYSEVWLEQQDGLDVPAFYAELPHTLRTDMASAIATPSLERIRCFQALKLDSGARRAVAARLQPLQLPPGMTLCEEGDDAAACWVLQHGTVSLLSHREEDQIEEEELVEGPALLGEAALLGAARGFPCHLATLRTLTRCTLWRLDAADFAAALRMHPQVQEAIRTVLLQGSPPTPNHLLKAQTSGREGALQIYAPPPAPPNPLRDPMGGCASRQADVEVEALEGQLAAARAAVRHAEGQAAEAEQRAKQHESKSLSLELERRRLAGQVAEMQRQLKQASGQRRQPKDGSAAANGGPAEGAAAAGRQQMPRSSPGAEPEGEGGLAAENERLRSELSELRTQLEAVLRENGELAERLMQVAFEQPPPPLDTPYKVERRSSKHERSSAAHERSSATATAAAAAAAAVAEVAAGQQGGEVERRGSGQRRLGSP
ncbi:voltage-gated potassium channel [Chlorella sorokiniana]|uniref:Voltage-gated potassium channel n=1 Tax=Chlorella sorokiniana TaxID=3076 RepID=A0A2P6TG78_CHLSO|nr:voltage-gated potassium channel [Chlorella sorokiniana]|eukprot:PRW33121.1 voltage-gated potassium channel [Chlorella sorokiniana]